ncbi:creatininase family protein [Rhodobacteraceae bacterium HSP-20]|uniref:Creatininase family protein n=1 Tax=Paragemmobacter amnigenus TaxID=2852097 RepID=A0ABS6J872_9RHOB|nr:creatininase family protein [Rhodobacter amnigenus]MBU9699950.1 creatininase family protein [Rhodobacter amnigenus]MBV4391177.1 creatininase family protein [Rhodobacter amnigenus]
MHHAGAWVDLTAPEFAALDLSSAVAILPLGASEQHGPHLAMSVDHDLVDAVLRRAMPLLDGRVTALVLPMLAVGKSNEHLAFAGTLSLSAETLLRVLTDLARCIAGAGVGRLMILNGHGGNRAVLEVAVRDIRAGCGLITAHVAWDELAGADDIVGRDEAENGLHGGDVETSAMLAAHPDKVRMALARDFGSAHRDWQKAHPDLGLGGAAMRPGWLIGDLNPAGAVGNAAAATAAKGEALLGTAAARLADLIVTFSHFDPR